MIDTSAAFDIEFFCLRRVETSKWKEKSFFLK